MIEENLKPRRGRPRKSAVQGTREMTASEKEAIESTQGFNQEEKIIAANSQDELDWGGAVKIKFRVDFDGNTVKDWYHKAQATSYGIKCEAEKTENGVYARIYDYGWWSLEMQYEGAEAIGEKLVNRIGYDFAPPWEDKKTRKPKYFATLEDAVKSITEFLTVQEKHNQKIENSPNAIQYNAPGRYQAIGI